MKKESTEGMDTRNHNVKVNTMVKSYKFMFT